MWGVDQDQLNPYEAYEGYVVRVPHNPLSFLLPYKPLWAFSALLHIFNLCFLHTLLKS
jgi:hypothetical protein